MDIETAGEILRKELAQALAEERVASDRCDAVGLAPHADGFQRLQQVSRDFAAAHQKVLTATKRLTALSRHGKIPEDLKNRTGTT
jgi:hypothetical protein